MVNAVPRVWVIQEGRNDYSPAEEFGEVHFVTKGDFVKFENSVQNGEVVADIRKFNTEYIPGVDFIIPAGNPVIVALVMMGLVESTHNILKWDGRRATYVPFKLNPIILK